MKIPADTRSHLVTCFSELINKNNIENFSNTPDFILAEYLVKCLEHWNDTIVARNDYYKRPIDPLHPVSELEIKIV